MDLTQLVEAINRLAQAIEQSTPTKHSKEKAVASGQLIHKGADIWLYAHLVPKSTGPSGVIYAGAIRDQPGSTLQYFSGHATPDEDLELVWGYLLAIKRSLSSILISQAATQHGTRIHIPNGYVMDLLADVIFEDGSKYATAFKDPSLLQELSDAFLGRIVRLHRPEIPGTIMDELIDRANKIEEELCSPPVALE